MLPIGPLMIEHRLIEKMIALLKKEAEKIEREKAVNVEFLNTAVDFIQTYGDRLHHGKEEDILFRELDQKNLSNEHRLIIEELREEHRQGRKALQTMSDATAAYCAGRANAVSALMSSVNLLLDLYPRHIDKEDNRFFRPCMEYLTPEEKESMLAREYEFDRNLIHQIYREKVMRGKI